MKASIKAGLSESEKQHFTFSNEEFKNLNWKNEKEFMLNNTMFDIIDRTSISNDSIKISCINDKKETELFANLSKHIDQNSDLTTSGKPISKVLLKLLKIEGLLIKEEKGHLYTEIEIPYLKHPSPIVTQYSNVSTPPPEQFCSKL